MTKKEMQARIDELDAQKAVLWNDKKDLEIELREASAFRDAERSRWIRHEEDLTRDVDSSKAVLRTLTIHLWGDKTDANLQYAVYGNGGGGVPEKVE